MKFDGPVLAGLAPIGLRVRHVCRGVPVPAPEAFCSSVSGARPPIDHGSFLDPISPAQPPQSEKTVAGT
jgi:hypothetical protein